MLLNDFFKILSTRNEGDKMVVEIQLDPEHSIFKGHFPGNPVVPGVCMIQLLKELLGVHLNKSFILKEASQLKFLTVLSPLTTPVLNVELAILEMGPEGLLVSGSFLRDEMVFMKYKTRFAEGSS